MHDLYYMNISALNIVHMCVLKVFYPRHLFDQKYSENRNIVKYCYNYFVIVNTRPLLRSSVSHDPSEIILICCVQKMMVYILCCLIFFYANCDTFFPFGFCDESKVQNSISNFKTAIFCNIINVFKCHSPKVVFFFFFSKSVFYIWIYVD